MSRSFIVLALPSALALFAALPSASRADASAGEATARRQVAFAPLFDPATRFTPGKTAKLRFRLQDLPSREPVAPADVSWSLLHRSEPELLLSPRRAGSGVYEVRFTPREPGQYRLRVAVRGASRNAIPPVRLGVVGVAAGLKEVAPGLLDAELERHARLKVKGTSAR